jgi:hypothetical protein
MIRGDGKMEYDSAEDTLLHIKRVNKLLLDVAKKLMNRSIYNLIESEKSLGKLKPTLDHHYANNSHYPEYYKNGIDDFTLIDLIEMFLDWMAASEQNEDGDIFRLIEINKKRFKISDQLVRILNNTVKEIF